MSPPRSTRPARAPQPKDAARSTRQRDAIAQALREANRPVTARQVLDLANKHAKGVGLATVYRTLKILLDSGEAVAVDIPGLRPLYEPAGKGHHHHFVCTLCERVFELEGECCGHFDALVPEGFRSLRHELTLYGLCDRCVRKRTTSVKKPKAQEHAGHAHPPSHPSHS